MLFMTLSARQEHIIDSLVAEYIQTAEPVSSQWLERRRGFEFSPATLRSEMKTLSDEGYLYQPHTSAGRIPTVKGYRLFVDRVVRKSGHKRAEAGRGDYFEDIANEENDLRALAKLAKKMSDLSSHLVLAALEARDILFQEGWEELLQEPEFEDREVRRSLSRFLQDFESSIDELDPRGSIDVYIGEENPFSNVADFSMMVAGYTLQKGEKGVLALVGPLRMPYGRNLRLLHSLMFALQPEQ
ncbi:MAG: hypothetical protein HYV78_02330 [Candidatus Wildermuthbacteria bacterium]|nr:hypothetical protein [Candidatus Wildermuthbacteria bacterium]